MSFVTAFVVAVPTANKGAYLENAKKADAFFKEKGAIRVVECWANDVPDGKVTSFPMAVKKADDETVAFGWIEWPSKPVAEAAFDEVMTHPDFAPGKMAMPFDGKRMIYGSFDVILEL